MRRLCFLEYLFMVLAVFCILLAGILTAILVSHT